ncbi:MAG: hypothetical protein HC838_15565 [Spirulinaceae cyanobacterium RM2_2_10]|nr:hypothetical protein [Spirulinaceae cyanobacterium SM2_1_0]NJO21169.1 hypothetical protein [Spirulinaceae cyanobacterium RM2_2_10]
MNRKLIGFCSVMTAVVGAAVGVATAELAANNYASPIYQNMHRKYAIGGAVVGLLVGASQEGVRQLKAKRDREEAEYEGQQRAHGCQDTKIAAPIPRPAWRVRQQRRQ